MQRMAKRIKSAYFSGLFFFPELKRHYHTAHGLCPLPCRYMAIIHPLKQRMSSTETKVVVGVIWVLALLLAFPQYYYSTTDQLPDRVVCYIDWPDYEVCDFKKM